MKLYVYGILAMAVFLQGCFKKQGNEAKPVVSAADVTLTAVYDSATPTNSYVKATAECGNISSVVFVYSSPQTPETEDRAECSATSSSGKTAIFEKRLAVQNPAVCQVLSFKIYGVLRNKKSEAIQKTLSFCVPSPPAPGFAITSGGGHLTGTGMSAFVTIGEPFGGVMEQTSATALNKPGLIPQVFDSN